jgi:putative SOS response-associated peptidase YedK
LGFEKIPKNCNFITMCYNVEAALLDELRYAIHRGDIHHAEELERQLNELQIRKKPIYFASGFSHPKLLCFTNDEPMKPQALSWGLIPVWAKDWTDADKRRKQTLNARVETMFDLPSFKTSAKSKRCLVYIDAFYEYHTANKRKYPFRISMADSEPMALGGLWNEWTDKATGEVHKTFSIVTTNANALMGKIHNEPSASDTPRMPVILPKEKQDEWLIDLKTEEDKKHIISLARPLDPDYMKAYTVPQLIGKNGVGNTEQARTEYKYEDLVF